MAANTEDVILLVSIGLVLVAAGGYMESVRQEVDGDFVEVTAQIESSEVVETELSSGLGPTSTFVPRINYTYTYEGDTYSSTTICSGKHLPLGSVFGCTSGGDKGGIQELVDQYQEGQQVTAYVNPRDPSEAYLNKKGFAFLNWLFIAVGFVFVLAGESEWSSEEVEYIPPAQPAYRTYDYQGTPHHAPPPQEQESLIEFIDDTLKIVIFMLFVLFLARVFGIV